MQSNNLRFRINQRVVASFWFLRIFYPRAEKEYYAACCSSIGKSLTGCTVFAKALLVCFSNIKMRGNFEAHPGSSKASEIFI